MANQTVASMTAATAFDGTELLYVVQGGANTKGTWAQALTYVTGGAATSMNVTGGTVTTSVPVFNATQTWNAGGITFTGWKLNVTDTASASASLLLDVQKTNVSQFSVTKNGLLISAGTGFSGSGNGGAFSWAGGVLGNSSTTPFFQSASANMWFGTGGNTPIIFSALGGTNVSIDLVSDTGRLRFGGSSDTILARDAANILGLRVTGTTASVFNVYREADSGLTATSYATIDAGKAIANTLLIGSQKTGLPANALTKLQINVDGTNKLDYGVTAASVWTFGASVIAPSGGFFQFSGRTYFESTADGNLVFRNNAGSDFGRLQLGGTTSSFPALKRSSASLQVRLADDSGNTNVEASSFYSSLYTFQMGAIGGVRAAMSAPASGIVKFDNSGAVTLWSQRMTVASLPAAASYDGGIAMVSDATATTARSTVSGGGSNKVMVQSDGTNWIIVG